MAVDWSMLEKLRESGAVKVSFHPDGTLASVEFGPPSVHEETQHAEPKPARRVSATGGLVQRAVVPVE